MAQQPPGMATALQMHLGCLPVILLPAVTMLKPLGKGEIIIFWACPKAGPQCYASVLVLGLTRSSTADGFSKTSESCECFPTLFLLNAKKARSVLFGVLLLRDLRL